MLLRSLTIVAVAVCLSSCASVIALPAAVDKWQQARCREDQIKAGATVREALAHCGWLGPTEANK